MKIGGTDILKIFKVLPWQQLLLDIAKNLASFRFCWVKTWKFGEISFCRLMLSNWKIGRTVILKMFKVLP